MNLLRRILPVAIVFLGLAISARATVTLNWVDWTAPTDYSESASFDFYSFVYANGTTGTIQMPDASIVNVTLVGEITQWSEFETTSNSFWATNNYNGTTYISANVPELPSNSNYIAVSGAAIQNQLLTFSQPVENIVMNIWSLGRPGDIGSWQFSQPFVILSNNNGELVGEGDPASLTSSGNTLSGFEGAGTIQFVGSFGSLSWEVLDPEVYAAWNIGVTSAAAPAPAPVPEPGQIAASLLLLAGIGGYVWMKRRKAAKQPA